MSPVLIWNCLGIFSILSAFLITKLFLSSNTVINNNVIFLSTTLFNTVFLVLVGGFLTLYTFYFQKYDIFKIQKPLLLLLVIPSIIIISFVFTKPIIHKRTSETQEEQQEDPYDKTMKILEFITGLIILGYIITIVIFFIIIFGLLMTIILTKSKDTYYKHIQMYYDRFYSIWKKQNNKKIFFIPMCLVIVIKCVSFIMSFRSSVDDDITEDEKPQNDNANNYLISLGLISLLSISIIVFVLPYAIGDNKNDITK